MYITRKILVPLAAIGLMFLSFSGKAAEPAISANDATLVVYRADEAAPTERLRVGVRVGGEMVGRLTREDAVASEHPAGTYTISTGIRGAETIEVDLKPGQVHYVRIDLRQRTQNLSIALVEVGEQVAHVERPELASAI